MLDMVTRQSRLIPKSVVDDYLIAEDAEGYSAFAQITARCSQQVNHAYAVYVWVKCDRVDRISYMRGSGKFGSSPGSDIVEEAVANFCAFMDGRFLHEAEEISLQSLIPNCAAHRNECQLAAAKTSGWLYDVLRQGGTMPFILMNWAFWNHRLKQIISETVDVRRDGRIRLGNASSVERLLQKLAAIPEFGSQGRALELAIRGLEGSTVDESMLRSAYQRSSLERLRARAEARGFIDPFTSSFRY